MGGIANVRHLIKISALIALRSFGMLRLARWLTRRQLRILCYHGGSIGDECTYNAKLFCTTAHIEWRLNWLIHHGFTPISLSTAVTGLQQGVLDTNLPVVVTLDDGWYSSAEAIIRPCLRRGLPVTLYLASQVAQRKTPVLDVTVHYSLWRVAPVTITLRDFSPAVDGVYDLGRLHVRRQLGEKVVAWLRSLPQYPAELSTELERFATAIGLDGTVLNLASRRFSYLDADELRQLASEGLAIELHGHSHHYPLGRPDLLRVDILACRDFVVSIGLPRPHHYCFPSGDFDDHASKIFDELGIESGTTCLPGLIDPAQKISLAFLPRFLDGGSISKIEFEAEMSGLLDLLRKIFRKA